MTRYSLVIATLDRPDRLRDTLRSVAGQSVLPCQVVVVDASVGDASEKVVEDFKGRLPVIFEKAIVASAAGQRNQGRRLVEADLIGFIDDDVVLEADVFEKLTAVFTRDAKAGGVAARMRGFGHKRPRGLLWWYYRWQAGYSHPSFGGKLFGPAINCLPCYEEDEVVDEVIEGQWLPAGVVLFRRNVFPGFPSFAGYSAYEDVYASASVAKLARLYFHTTAWYDHFPTEETQGNSLSCYRMANRFQNQDITAREVLKLGRCSLCAKMTLHRLFMTMVVMLGRDSHRWKLLRAIWSFPHSL